MLVYGLGCSTSNVEERGQGWCLSKQFYMLLTIICGILLLVCR
jgi:hypothetical protein